MEQENKKIQEELKKEYLKPRNDLSDFDVNEGKKFTFDKMEYCITLVTPEITDKKKILSTKINKYHGVFDDLLGVVDTDSPLKPSLYHQVDE